MTCECGATLVKTGLRGPMPKWCPACAKARKAARERRDRARRNERQRARRANGYKPPPRIRPNNYLQWRRWVAENPEHAARLSSAASQRRRARLAGAPVVENFTSQEILERDNWTCHLCGGHIEGRWPEPTSPSIDHVIPLARGGHHSRANVKAAHLVCNVRKGARRA